MIRSLTSIAPIVGFAMVGCSLAGCGHNPRNLTALAPAAALPSNWQETAALPLINTQPDAVLSDLFKQVSDGPDVVIASGRLLEAQERLKAARSGLLPSVSTTGTFSLSGAEGSSNVTSASGGLALNGTLDLFGANRARIAALAAGANAADYDKARVQSLVRFTFTQLYVAYRSAQAQILVTQANLDSANDTRGLAISRQQAGLETGLGVAQATNNRDAIAARLPGYEQAKTSSRLGMEALIGQNPGSLTEVLQPVAPIPSFDLRQSIIAPDAWLKARPDLVAASYRLNAAGLDARAAQRDRLPTLSLSALVFQSDASRGPSGSSGSLTANLLATIFDFGRLEALAQVAGARAQTEAALYNKTILDALADVETQASKVRRGEEAIVSQNASVVSATDQANLARVRYTSGLTDFLNVLTAQRAVFEAQSSQVNAQTEAANAQYGLATALGY